ncbi:hypothetical protein C1645_824909, partial [Glomus cerebriforme]
MASPLSLNGPARDILMSRAPVDAARISRLPSPTSAIVPDLLDKAFSLGIGGDTLGMVDLVATSHCEVVDWPSASGSSGSSSLNNSISNNDSSSSPSSPPLAPNKRVRTTTDTNMDEDFATPPISGPAPQAEAPLSPTAIPFVPSSSPSTPHTPQVETVDASIHATSSISKGKNKVTDDEEVPLDAAVQISSSIFFAAAAPNSYPALLKKFKTNSALCAA